MLLVQTPLRAVQLGLVFASIGLGVSAEETVVVEFFTSQSCGMCPSANALQVALSKKPDVIALTLNVNYWDYLGWKDDLALPENSLRQRAYARAVTSRRVYTPQMMIDGTFDVTGNRKVEVYTAIETLRADADKAAISIQPEGNELRVSIPAAESRDESTIWLAGFDNEITREITGGENEGRTIIYANVVREWRNLGRWNGSTPFSLVISKPKGDGGVAVIVQIGDAGPILGAAQHRY